MQAYTGNARFSSAGATVPPSFGTEEVNQRRIFIVSALADDRHRRDLKKHLRPADRSGVIQVSQTDAAGSVWLDALRAGMESADVVVVLGSVELFANEELDDLLGEAFQRELRGGPRVLPVRLRACIWECTPFHGRMQIPRDGCALVKDGEVPDVRWAEIGHEILHAAGAGKHTSQAPGASVPLSADVPPSSHSTALPPQPIAAGYSTHAAYSGPPGWPGGHYPTAPMYQPAAWVPGGGTATATGDAIGPQAPRAKRHALVIAVAIVLPLLVAAMVGFVLVRPDLPPPPPPPRAVVLLAATNPRSSSALPPNEAQFAFDGSKETAWCEAANGDGSGEWLEASAPAGFVITEVTLTGGWDFMSPKAAAYSGNPDMWAHNNVATRLRVTWSGGSTTVTFSRSDRGVSRSVPISPAATRVRILVEATNRSTGANNTCLDGLELRGYRGQAP